MINEFSIILKNSEIQLKEVKVVDDEFLSVQNEVIELQKKLLNVSLLSKENLEKKIKSELKQKEIELIKLMDNKAELECAYLYKYIRENYE